MFLIGEWQERGHSEGQSAFSWTQSPCGPSPVYAPGEEGSHLWLRSLFHADGLSYVLAHHSNIKCTVQNALGLAGPYASSKGDVSRDRDYACDTTSALEPWNPLIQSQDSPLLPVGPRVFTQAAKPKLQSKPIRATKWGGGGGQRKQARNGLGEQKEQQHAGIRLHK